MSRITIREVARYVGVSHQTVSRVINGSPDVAQETRAQVQQAIRELDYHPNAQAVSLSRNRSGIVGMIVDRAGDTFFGPIVDGACKALTERDRFMLLAETDYLEQPTAVAALLRSRRIDGMILALPLADSLEQARQVAEEGRIPLVLVDLQYPIDADHIAIDNVQGGYVATQHLLQLGHRRIGIICGPAQLPVSQARLRGYSQALQEYSIIYRKELVVPGEFRIESGVKGTTYLLGLAEPPTAIFCSDDQMAIGALRTLLRNGIRVPEDISLIGFDDIQYAEHTYPSLTTVRQPLHDMGYLAGSHICNIVDGSSEALRLTLVPELVIRESTATMRL